LRDDYCLERNFKAMIASQSLVNGGYMPFDLSLYVCNRCGSDLDIDYEYHDGTIRGLRRDEVSVFCTNEDCGWADIFTGIAISRVKWEKKHAKIKRTETV
jgi:hypothetical protein